MSTAGTDSWAAPGTLDAGTTPPTVVSTLAAADGYWGYYNAWWSLTYPDDTYVTIDTSASTVPPSPTGFVGAQMYLTTGGTDEYDATYLDGASDGGGGEWDLPKFGFLAEAGVTYKIVLGQYYPDLVDDMITAYVLDVTAIPLAPPPNDDLANAQTIRVTDSGEVLMAAATVEPDEVDLFGEWSFPDEKSVWYRYVAATDGRIGFRVLDGDNGDTSNPLWWLCQGTDMTDLTIIGFERNGGAGNSVEVEAGQEYLIRFAVTDDATVMVQWELRHYAWTDWQDNDTTTKSGFALLTMAASGYGPGQATSGSMSDSARGAWFQSAIDAEYAALQADFDGTDDSFFLPPNSGTSNSPITGVFHETNAHGQVIAVGPSVNCDMSDTAQMMSIGTSVDTFDDTSVLEYESTTGLPIAAHLVLDWGMVKIVGPSIWSDFNGEYGVKVYYPSTADSKILKDEYQSQYAVPMTTVVNGGGGTATVDLDASAFVASESGYEHRVDVYGLMSYSAPVALSSIGSGNDSGLARLRGDVIVDSDLTTFTFQNPRFRQLLVVEEPPPASTIPPRRLWPRDDSLFGIGRNYPPPNTRQAGHRFGSGAPV